MHSKKVKVLSVLLALLICISVISPIGVFAGYQGGSNGVTSSVDSGSAGSGMSEGMSAINNSACGVRIYLTTDKLIQDNLDGDTLKFGSKSVTKWLDMYKSLAIYEISDSRNKGQYSYVSDILNGNRILSACYKDGNDNTKYNKAFVLKADDKRETGTSGDNMTPDFHELLKDTKFANDSVFTPWQKRNSGAHSFTFGLGSLSDWANRVFAAKDGVDLTKFLSNYKSVLEGYGVPEDVRDWLPDTSSQFIQDNWCIIVEPVMVTVANDTGYTYAWGVQDSKYKVTTKDNTEISAYGKQFYWTKEILELRKDFYINYKSNKYNKEDGYLVTTSPDAGTTANRAGGFAFYYSSDVVAKDVPVQVANTVVVDVGAPKYIKSGTSADAVPPVGSVR